MQLYDLQGQRLYLTSTEREEFLEAAKKALIFRTLKKGLSLIGHCGRGRV